MATAGLFNANTTPFYNLTVRTTDDGTPPLNGSGTVRININASQLYFDPNGTAAGSVADAGSYGWRTTSWAAGPGGTAAVANWIPNAQAIFAATTPPGPLAYDVDIASYNSATHGGFGAIRALAGTVRFTGNVDNFYLLANTAVEAAPGAAIEFNQTRSGNSLLAFNLNFQTVTFDGDVTFNNCGMGNTGNVVVNSGKLALNAANPYTGSTTVNSGTLSLLGSGAIYTTLDWANQTVTLNPGTTLELDRLGRHQPQPRPAGLRRAEPRHRWRDRPQHRPDQPAGNRRQPGLHHRHQRSHPRIRDRRRNVAHPHRQPQCHLRHRQQRRPAHPHRCWRRLDHESDLSGTTTALIKTGTGTWNLGGTNTYGGGTTVSAGTLQCNNTASLPGAATVESNSSDETKFGTLFMNLGNTTWSQDVSGSGLWKVATGSGSQTTVLSGNYSAFNGTLEVATGSGKIHLGTAANYPAAGSIIQLNPNTTVYLSGGGTLQSDIRLFGGTIGEPTYGQLRVGISATLNGDITLHGNTTIAVDSSRTGIINGVIGESGGNFGFTKNQPGTLLLSADNTYTGGTTVNAGILQTRHQQRQARPGQSHRRHRRDLPDPQHDRRARPPGLRLSERHRQARPRQRRDRAGGAPLRRRRVASRRHLHRKQPFI